MILNQKEDQISKHPSVIHRISVRNKILQNTNQGPLFSWIDLNLTELCNRTCNFCPRGQKYENNNYHMSKDTINNIKIQLEKLEFCGVINICGNSEPLLGENLYFAIKSLNKFHIEIVTNGDKLNKKNLKKLYDLGVNMIFVSIYEEKDLSKFNTIFSSVNTHKFVFRLHTNLPPLATNRASAMPTNFTPQYLNTPCNYPSYHMQIDWNGDILLCPHNIWKKNIKFGNVNEQELKTIWFDKKYSKIRKSLFSDRKNGICDNCDATGILYGSDYASSFKKIL